MMYSLLNRADHMYCRCCLRGDFILVGDLMRSLSLLIYKQEEGCLEQRAQVSGPGQHAGMSRMGMGYCSAAWAVHGRAQIHQPAARVQTGKG